MSIIICCVYSENILFCFLKTYIWRPRIFIMKYELSSFEYRQMIIGKTYESYTSWNAWISNWKHHEFFKLFCWIWINKIIVKGIFLNHN